MIFSHASDADYSDVDDAALLTAAQLILADLARHRRRFATRQSELERDEILFSMLELSTRAALLSAMDLNHNRPHIAELQRTAR